MEEIQKNAIKEVPKHIMENEAFIVDLRRCTTFPRLITILNELYGSAYLLLPTQLETLHAEKNFKNWAKLRTLFSRLWDGNDVTPLLGGLARQLNMTEEQAKEELEKQLKLL